MCVVYIFLCVCVCARAGAWLSWMQTTHTTWSPGEARRSSSTPSTAPRSCPSRVAPAGTGIRLDTLDSSPVSFNLCIKGWGPQKFCLQTDKPNSYFFPPVVSHRCVVYWIMDLPCDALYLLTMMGFHWPFFVAFIFYLLLSDCTVEPKWLQMVCPEQWLWHVNYHPLTLLLCWISVFVHFAQKLAYATLPK